MAKQKIGHGVVAIRMRQLGDVLATLDALRALKEAEPQREISYIVDEQFHSLLANEPYIDNLLPSPPRGGGWRGAVAMGPYISRLRRLRPAVVLDFHSNPRSALITLLSGAKTRVGFDVKIRKAAYNVVEPRRGRENGGVDSWNSAESALRLARHANVGGRTSSSLPELTIESGAVARGRDLLTGAGVPPRAIDDGVVVGINPGKAYQSKAWPEAYFVQLAHELSKRGMRVVVVWGPDEEVAARRIAGAAGNGVIVGPETRLAELPGLLKHLSCLVTIDSGLKHLAVCTRTPTVTIFGSTSPLEWHIGTDKDVYLWRGYSCSPCRMFKCPFGTPCMADITPPEVLTQISKLFSKGASRWN